MNAGNWRLREPRLVATAAVLGVATAIAGYLAAGATLGWYLSGIVFAALIVAPLVAAAPPRSARGAVVAGTSVSIAIIWLIAGPGGSLRAAIVLLCWAGAIAGLTTLLRTSTIAIVLVALWLSWPLWLAPRLSGQRHARLVQTLVSVHPIFAINGATPQLGVWTQHPIMYRLSPLGQDLPYRLPTSIWPSALTHALIAAGLLIPPKKPAAAPAGDAPSDR